MSDTNAILPRIETRHREVAEKALANGREFMDNPRMHHASDPQRGFIVSPLYYFADLVATRESLANALRRLAELEAIAREYRAWHEGDCGITRTLPEIVADFDRLLPLAPTEAP